MKSKSVLLDTSFFLRFLNENDPLFENADGYFRFFLQNDIRMMISTISIAEYCIGGDISELPLRNLQILPFNIQHAMRTGEFARSIFMERRKGDLIVGNRNIIPNDSKLFAQADFEKSIQYYLSSDKESNKIYSVLKKQFDIKFIFMDLHVSFSDFSS